tara:strand:+ start:1687 stop:2787 length:1101 start_codon:yes stop_codon:yes gene_type:complete
MNPFTESGAASLLTSNGREFLGLRNSSSPEIAIRMQKLFDYLNGKLGFAENVHGFEAQSRFNLLLRYAYPELTIDLADILYVQHERLTVFLNLEHLHINLKNDSRRLAKGISLETLFAEMEFLFQQLAEKLKQDSILRGDPVVTRLLAESYAYYVHQTGNLPWELPVKQAPFGDSVLDVASGLAGFSLIQAWEDNASLLILNDHSAFILQTLELYKTLSGKKNVEILDDSFPDAVDLKKVVNAVWVEKFLHHLKRGERRRFLAWVFRNLAPKGILKIIDTDLERQILRRSQEFDFEGKLIPGYLETLVDIEEEFCVNLENDIRGAGFRIAHLASNEYLDETDAYSLYPGDNLKLKFTGVEILAERN